MQNYIRLSVASIADVLPLIGGKDKRVIVDGEYVKVSSLRLKTFAKYGTKCSCCGLEATHFAIERCAEQESYHLNLYGLDDGKEVLFTHDHTLARSLGGKDNISNTTTMCSPCNFKKSIIERELKEAMRREKN